MKQKIIGTYSCGVEEVQLVLREGTGGEFWTMPEKGCIARIKVGANMEWPEVMSALLHEALELQMHRIGCRFDPTGDCGRDHSSYLFVMTHPQFSNVVGRAAQFASAALPDLAKAWKKWGKGS